MSQEEIALKSCPFCGGTDISEETVGTWPAAQCDDCGAFGPSIELDKSKANERWNTRAVPAQGEPVAWREALDTKACISAAIAEAYKTGGVYLSVGLAKAIVREVLAALPAQDEPVAQEILAAFLKEVPLGDSASADDESSFGIEWHFRDGSVFWIDIDPTSGPRYLWRNGRGGKAISNPLAALPSSPAPRVAPHNSGERLPSSDAAEGAGEAIFTECAEIALEHVGMWEDGRYDEACRDIAEAIRTRASNRKTMDAIADAALLKP
jgi:Lar family restriction alleviation protein